MTTILFQYSRKLRISRFTIDVLMERLTNLRPQRKQDDEWAGFVGRTYESLQACERLHNELGEEFGVVQACDADDFPSLADRFEDLHRRISESIATLNSFENGAARSN